jgi:hypothetical protein
MTTQTDTTQNDLLPPYHDPTPGRRKSIPTASMSYRLQDLCLLRRGTEASVVFSLFHLSPCPLLQRFCKFHVLKLFLFLHATSCVYSQMKLQCVFSETHSPSLLPVSALCHWTLICAPGAEAVFLFCFTLQIFYFFNEFCPFTTEISVPSHHHLPQRVAALQLCWLCPPQMLATCGYHSTLYMCKCYQFRF